MNIYTKRTKHVDTPGIRVDGADWPFPSKPVSHRRPHDPRTRDSLQLYDFEKITISKHIRGPESPEPHSNGVTDIPGSHHLRQHSPKPPRGEMQMARAIHAKELMLQEKLWRVEEKIRHKIQRGVDIAAGDERKTEDSYNRRPPVREKAHTQTRLSEHHWREPVKSREDLMQERIQEDVKELRKKQSHRDEDRKRETCEEERARWKNREMEFVGIPQSKVKGNDITLNKQKVGGELDKLRQQNVKEHTKIQWYEKDHCDGGEAGVRSQKKIEKPNERDLHKAPMRNTGRTRENKYRERTFKEMYGSDNEQDMPRMGQHKTAHRLATENPRGAECTIFEESSFPPVSNSSHSSRPMQEEVGLTETTDPSFHLLPCSICNRKFASGRLEKHLQICKKVNRSHRKVFNSYINRTKGSVIEEFQRNHGRNKTPEV